MSATENYKAFKFKLNKKTSMRDLIETTDSPFSWFPELENLFRNFDIKELKFELESKTYFLIRKFDHERPVKKRTRDPQTS